MVEGYVGEIGYAGREWRGGRGGAREDMGVRGPEDPDDICQQNVSPSLTAVVAVPIDLQSSSSSV
jgi:hypothetical protein